MDLKIKDISEMLHLSETTIRRWVKEGFIPYYRLNNQVRFNRTEIEAWMLRRKREKQENPPTEENPWFRSIGTNRFSLSRSLHQGHVFLEVHGKNKEEVIRETMKKLSQSLPLDPEVLSELLIDREKLMSTALNQGLALPHTRDFFLPKDVVVIAYLKEPIPYGALDEEPVHTLFFLFASEDKRHLNLLAKIARFSQDAAHVAFLKERPSKEKLLKLIKAWEASLDSLGI